MTCENGDVAVPATRTPLTFFAIEANQDQKLTSSLPFLLKPSKPKLIQGSELNINEYY